MSCGNPENRSAGGQNPVTGCDGTRRHASRTRPRAASQSRLRADGGMLAPAADLGRNRCRREHGIAGFAGFAGRRELSCCVAPRIVPDVAGPRPRPRQMPPIWKGGNGKRPLRDQSRAT